jgi:hypothetical protein
MGCLRSSGRRFSFVAGLLLLTAYVVPGPVSAQSPPEVRPIIGPERPVSYPVPATPQDGYAPAVAFGASTYLVVWQDGKAARVDRSGTVLDASPIHLGLSASQPDVAFDGENFLVVSNPYGPGGGIQGVRVSPNGDVLDASPIVVSDQEPVSPPKVVFDGTDHLVVWGSQEGVNRAVVSPAGIVVEPAALLVASPGATWLDVAFNGSRHLVTWSHLTDVGPAVYGLLVDRSGSVLGPAAFPISDRADSRSEPTVASFGSTFLVAWDHHHDGSGATEDVYASRVDADGSVLDPTGIPIATAPGLDWAPEATSDGTNVLVVWTSGAPGWSPTVRGTRVTPSGAVLDPSGFPVSTLDSWVAVAFGGPDFFVVGMDPQAIRGARLTPAGAVLDPVAVLISMGANEQVAPAATSDGTNTLVLWQDNRHGDRVLYGGRVGPDGQVLDGQGFRISDGNQIEGGEAAFDGTNFFVVWREWRQPAHGSTIRVARVSRSGVVLDRFDVVTAGPDQGISDPTMAFGGGTLLVAWNTWGEGVPTDSEIRAARVAPDGTVTDPSGFAVTGGHVQYDLAFGGVDFLFVWSRSVGADDDIFGTRVTTTGTVVTPGGFPVASGAAFQTEPQVAWNGDRHLVVWTEVADWSDGDTHDIRGARLDGSGTVLDPAGIPISTGPGWKNQPLVAANGSFLVTWFDRRRREDTDDLYAARIDPDGAVAHADGFEVAPSVTSWFAFSSAPGSSDGTFSVTYGRYLADRPYGTNRIFNRSVDPK